MSVFFETITLSNIKDEVRVEAGLLKEVRSVTLDACVDTGAWTLVINEKVRAQLGLEIKNSMFSTLADGSGKKYDMTEAVNFRWQDREYALPALLIPEAKDILFGALPMESLDVMADTVEERLKGRHGDQRIHRV
ncbi:MAG: aspartyl protease family protein [Spirochaetaceae bacterium]|jgi:hypothetical protein|nr:aspartyl protease family protein [Spirochaetaceae bacterium]